MRAVPLLAVGLILFAMLFLLGGDRAATGQIAEPLLAKGIVFHDANENGQLDVGEIGLAGIRVSNGIDIVTTAANGAYEISLTDDSIVFVLKPSGWQVPLSVDQLPRFY